MVEATLLVVVYFPGICNFSLSSIFGVLKSGYILCKSDSKTYIILKVIRLCFAVIGVVACGAICTMLLCTQWIIILGNIENHFLLFT